MRPLPTTSFDCKIQKMSYILEGATLLQLQPQEVWLCCAAPLPACLPCLLRTGVQEPLSIFGSRGVFRLELSWRVLGKAAEHPILTVQCSAILSRASGAQETGCLCNHLLRPSQKLEKLVLSTLSIDHRKDQV